MWDKDKDNLAINQSIKKSKFLHFSLSIKLPHAEFVAKAQALGIQTVPIIFEKEFSSRGELLATCEAYFAQHVIEGIVVKTPDSKFSAKIMNNYYDSKK